MPDITGFKGFMQTLKSMRGATAKEDTYLPPEGRKKKGLMDRFIQSGSKADQMRSGFNTLRNLSRPKK